MLVLSRRRGDKIVIHEDIVLTVLEVRGSTVRLGIEAPREVPVHRAEVVLTMPIDGAGDLAGNVLR